MSKFVALTLFAWVIYTNGGLQDRQVLHAAAPNILIVTIDDMSCDSVGAFGSKLVGITPNMDQLAKTAMRFKFAHVQVGNCMPSRNVMWSGRYPHNNGVEGFYQVKSPSYPVLCDLAQQSGYYTAIRHKVNHSTPNSPYGWDLVLDTDAAGQPLHVKDAASYGVCAKRAIQAAEHAGKPFCVLINVADPHKPFYSEVKNGSDPYVPSRIYSGDEVPVPGFLPDDPIIRDELARYYSSVRRADDAVGSVLGALEETGHHDDTLILFCADHGMPLPFAKTQVYHHSTHTPLMVRWPGITTAGTEDTQHMVSAVDFLPTLLDAIGCPKPEGLDGRSFVSLLRGETQSDRDFVLKEYNENSGGKRNPMRAIETHQYLYIFNPWSDGQLKMATATNGTDTYRRMKELAATDTAIAKRVDIADFRTIEELYDVQADPDCLNNLLGDQRFDEVANRLRNQLMEQMLKTADPLADALQHRHDRVWLSDFMSRVQAEADSRRASKGKGQRDANPRRKNQSIISLDVSAIDRSSDAVVIPIQYAIPSGVDTLKLTVTLKDAKNKRIERQEYTIRGNGTQIATFSTPASVSGKLGVAAFVGPDFQSNLQYVQAVVP
ncbi:MAG: sulfatase [Planctomycetales bacterium]|nr:sulfatase [Planctomycetales bacterium]